MRGARWRCNWVGDHSPRKFVPFVISTYFNLGNRPEPVADKRVLLCMERELVSEQIQSLQVEAIEARRLAETLRDPQSIRDLEKYATELEAEAARLGLRTNRSMDTQKRRELETAAPTGNGLR